jgi:hypothetical protein
MKPCASCKIFKPVEEYALRTRRGGQEYRFSYCGECNKGKAGQYYRDRRDADPEAARKRTRKAVLRQYGLTPEQYDEMIAKQDGRCAICGQFPGTTMGVDRHNLTVDHDHATGAVRELLCDFCNRGLGIFRDDPDTLIAAAMYLLKHSAQEGGG